MPQILEEKLKEPTFQAEIPKDISAEALGAAETLEEPTREQQLGDIQTRIQELTGQISGTAGVVAELTREKGGEFVPEFQKQFPIIASGFGKDPSGRPTIDPGFEGTPEDVGRIPRAPIPQLVQKPITEAMDWETISEKAGLTEIKKTLGEKVKGFFGATDTTETPSQIAERLFPDLPERVGQLDTQLAQLRTGYQQERQQMEVTPGGTMFHLRGQQARLDRSYEIKRQGLLLERDAAIGDYDRAVDRAKFTLGLELEERAENRENQKMAVEMLMAEAEVTEKRLYESFLRQLDRQEATEQRDYQAKIKEQDEIKSIIASEPQAFIGKEWPKSFDEAIRMKGEFAAAEPEDVTADRKLYDEAVAAGYTKTFPEFLRERGILEEPEVAKAPTTKEVGGVLYQWDIATETWKPAVGVKPVPPKTVTVAQQRQVDKDFAERIEDEKGAFYRGLKQVDAVGGKRPTMEELADLAATDGVSYQGFKDALAAYSGMKMYPDGEVWTSKFFNQRVGNVNDESVKDKFEISVAEGGVSDEELEELFFTVD